MLSRSWRENDATGPSPAKRVAATQSDFELRLLGAEHVQRESPRKGILVQGSFAGASLVLCRSAAGVGTLTVGRVDDLIEVAKILIGSISA